MTGYLANLTRISERIDIFPQCYGHSKLNHPLAFLYFVKSLKYLLLIVRLRIWHHLFLEFYFFAHWRHQRVVTRLENVRQLNIRRGKKLGFQLSHRQPLNVNLTCPQPVAGFSYSVTSDFTIDDFPKDDFSILFYILPFFQIWKFKIEVAVCRYSRIAVFFNFPNSKENTCIGRLFF